MRLDRLLATLGVATRSRGKELIKSGCVRVNGQIIRDVSTDVLENDRVEFNGKPLDIRTQRHLMLYKPGGVLTAAEDRNQITVMDLLPPVYKACGCMPVGRLDKDTTGLLILTTDGELAHRLITPARHVDKVYEACVEGKLEEADAAAFLNGVPLKDFTALPAKLEILSDDRARVTVREGKYHQVKRMFGARGKPVTALHRVAFGPLMLDQALRPGEFRELTGEETALLYAAAGMKP